MILLKYFHQHAFKLTYYEKVKVDAHKSVHVTNPGYKPLSLMYIHKSELKPKQGRRINNVASFFRGLRTVVVHYTAMFLFFVFKNSGNYE